MYSNSTRLESNSINASSLSIFPQTIYPLLQFTISKFLSRYITKSAHYIIVDIFSI